MKRFNAALFGLLLIFSGFWISDPASAESNRCDTSSIVDQIKVPGGHDLVVEIFGDTEFTYIPVPDPSWDPLTASNSELEHFGFPPKPQGNSSLDEWAKEVSGIHISAPSDLCLASTSTFELTHIAHFWSGYVTVPTANVEYRAVAATYHEPDIGFDACGSSFVSNWVGLGGLNEFGHTSAGLIQAGTMYDPTTTKHSLWYEYLDASSNGQPQITVNDSRLIPNPGVEIRVSVYYYPASQSSTFTFLNVSTGSLISFNRKNMNNYFDGSTAEVIIERPTLLVGGIQFQTTLANFGTTHFSSVYATGSNGTEGLYSWNRMKLYMTFDGTANSNSLDAVTASTSANSFDATWLSCD